VTVVRKYPTAYDNVGAWQNPAYILNAPDSLCSRKILTANQGSFDIYVSGFGFAIPSNATLSRITMGFNACYYPVSENIATQLRLTKGTVTNVKTDTHYGTICSQAIEQSTDVYPLSDWTPNDLNNENFTMLVRAINNNPSSNSGHYVDCVFLEVEYTAVAVKKPIMKMDLGPHPRSRLLFAPTLMLKGTGAGAGGGGADPWEGWFMDEL
jgi:hypothetical protein